MEATVATRDLSSRSYFTLGYQLRPLEEFVGELAAADVDLVVDVRETPWSRKPGFSKKALSEALAGAGIAYAHARFAGNPRELRRNSSAHDEVLASYRAYLSDNPELLERLTEFLEDLDVRAERVCFVCYERHPHDCHRHILLDMWQEALGVDLQIEHLARDGAPRLATA